MKKVLNNIFKWLILVVISYSLVLTGMMILEQGGIVEAVAYKIDSMDGDIFDHDEIGGVEEVCKYQQELADRTFSYYYDEDLGLSEEEINRQKEQAELYEKYPAGYSMLIRDVAMLESMSNLHITSLVMGIAIGTAIYMMLDKDKKGLKVLISLYIIFVILLGFVEGIQTIDGEELSLLEKWVFPETFIIPITAVFVLAFVVRILRHKDIAKQLNIKLQEKRNKRMNDEN